MIAMLDLFNISIETHATRLDKLLVLLYHYQNFNLETIDDLDRKFGLQLQISLFLFELF